MFLDEKSGEVNLAPVVFSFKSLSEQYVTVNDALVWLTKLPESKGNA